MNIILNSLTTGLATVFFLKTGFNLLFALVLGVAASVAIAMLYGFICLAEYPIRLHGGDG